MKNNKALSDVKAENREKLNSLVIEMLVCPLTKTRLSLSSDKSELISLGARVAFPIKKGVPLLCLDEARTLSADEIDSLSRG